MNKDENKTLDFLFYLLNKDKDKQDGVAWYVGHRPPMKRKRWNERVKKLLERLSDMENWEISGDKIIYTVETDWVEARVLARYTVEAENEAA